MNYELLYHLMCTVDGTFDKKTSARQIVANDDVEAIRIANDILAQEKSGLVIPYAPRLHQGERAVAMSDPAYPPRAHHLSWVCATKEEIPRPAGF